jgi:hypothetical protein
MNAHCNGAADATDKMKKIAGSTEAWCKKFMGSVYKK